MRLQTKIVGSGIVIAALVLAAWLALPTAKQTELGFVEAPTLCGNEAFPLVVIWVSNKSPGVIRLISGSVQREYQGGHIVTNTSLTVAPGHYTPCILAAKHDTLFAFGLSAQSGRVRRFQVNFDYTRDGGRVRTVISRIVRKLPAKLLPKCVTVWLLDNGLLDGQLHLRCEFPWMPLPPEAPRKETSQ